MRLLALGRVLASEPAMTIRRDRRLEEEVVAERESQRELMMIRARVIPQREGWRTIHRRSTPRLRNVAEQQIVGRVLLVDEDNVFDLRARPSRFAGNRMLRVLAAAEPEVPVVIVAPVFGEAVVDVDAGRVFVQLALRRHRDDVDRAKYRELRRPALAHG